MLEKLKGYWQALLAVALAVMTALFLYEKSKRESAEAIADNKEDLDKLAELDRVKAANSGKLDAEESKREDIKKETNDAKADDSDDASDFLDKR